MPKFDNWFVYSALAVILYGGVDFLYKAAAHFLCSSRRILNTSAITVSFLSLLFILITKSAFANFELLVLFALINSFFFAVGSISKIQSLKYIPSSYAFPVAKLNSVFLILYSIVLFNDKPNALQWTGILISVSIPIFLGLSMQNKNNVTHSNVRLKGLFFAVIAAFSTSLSMLAGKYASSSVPNLNYMFVSYLFVVFYTLILNRVGESPEKEKPHKYYNKILLFGIPIGILNFAGYYFVLQAFASGPLSLIQGITSNSFVISVLLAILIFKERFTYKNAIVVALAVISILLIKIF